MPDQQEDLSEAFIAQQRTRLEAMRRELLGGEESTIANERMSRKQHGDEAAEFEDDAQNMAQDEINQSLRNVNDHRIGDIQRALQKIFEGSCGLSDESGDPIPQGPARSHAGGYLHCSGAGTPRDRQVTRLIAE